MKMWFHLDSANTAPEAVTEAIKQISRLVSENKGVAGTMYMNPPK